MIHTLYDFAATFAEASMLYILASRKPSSTRFLLCAVPYVLFIRFLTLMGLTPAEKLLMAALLDLALSILLLGIRFSGSVVFALIHLICIYVGDIFLQSILMILFRVELSSLFRPEHTVLLGASILLSKAMGLLLCLFLRTQFGTIEYRFETPASFLACLPLGVVLLIMSILENSLLNGLPFPAAFESILSVGLIMAALCLLHIYRWYFRLREVELEKELAERQLRETFSYYQNRLAQDQNIRKLYHDLSAHMATLEQMPATPRRQQYQEELLGRFQDLTLSYDTGHEIVDLVLSEKKSALDAHSVKVVLIGDFRLLNRISPFDLVTIFHNAIDNSIHAYESFSGSQRRILEIQIWRCRNFIHLRFVNGLNPSASPPEKTDRRLHGFGLRNMESAVARYGGEMSANVEYGRFCLRIIFPVPDENSTS